MTNPKAYYNEVDAYAAQWLRNLIAAGLVPAGDVDERDIRDVCPSDLAGYTQCHFFAGIGGWPLALRLAGWPDDRPVWTGSCPCQPFSAAGKRGGTDDERHLWPHFHWLISQRRPAIVLGEQVASKEGLGWLDLVSADLEGEGYAVAAVDLCAAGVSAPHIRQRLWWVGLADACDDGLQRGLPGRTEPKRTHFDGPPRRGSADRRMVDADSSGRSAGQRHDPAARHGSPSTAARSACRMADAPSRQFSQPGRGSQDRNGPRPDGAHDSGSAGRTGSLHVDWRDADWLLCRDGRWRPVEPGTFPLAHGLPARVGRLRAYGNAIVPQVAAAFIEAVMGG